ncbi:MAG TPA: AAA family ATPase, partial [Bacteroidia bacterium]
MRTIFVTGSSTDVGKTVVSAVLTQALKADYWKPIQTGAGFDSDTERVKKLVTNTSTVFHKE